MKLTPCLALAFLLPLSAPGASPRLQEEQPADKPAPGSGKANLQKQLQKVRAYADNYPTLRYTIFDHRKTLGQYIQKTKVTTLKTGREVLDLVDSYNFFRNNETRTKRTRAHINKNLDIIEVTGESATQGSIGIKIRNGKLQGINFDGRTFSYDPPEHMMTRDLLQRGLYDLPTKLGETLTVDLLALENIAEQKITGKLNIIAKGFEETTAQGVTYKCRKYVLRADNEKRAAQCWFDEEHRLVKLRTGLQTWELMSPGQSEPLPVKRMPNPTAKRKKERQEAKKKAEEGKKEKGPGEEKGKDKDGEEQDGKL